MPLTSSQSNFVTRFNRHFQREKGSSVIFQFVPGQRQTFDGETYYRYRLLISPLPSLAFAANNLTPSWISTTTIERIVRDGFGQLGFEIKRERNQGLIWKSLNSQRRRRLYIAHIISKDKSKEWIKLGNTSCKNPQNRFLHETVANVKIESVRFIPFWSAPTKNCIYELESSIRRVSLDRLRSLYPSIDFVFGDSSDEYPLIEGGNSECMEIPSSLDFRTIRDIIWSVYDEWDSSPTVSTSPKRTKQTNSTGPKRVKKVKSTVPSSLNDLLTIAIYLKKFLNNKTTPGYDLTPWQFLQRYKPLKCKKLADARPTYINSPGVFKSILLQSKSVRFKIETPSPMEITCYIDGSRLLVAHSEYPIGFDII